MEQSWIVSLFLILINQISCELSGHCRKNVAGVNTYILVGSVPTKTHIQDGLKHCVYRLDGDNAKIPKKYFCQEGKNTAKCIPVPLPGGCFDPSVDHMPSYWIPLLENPCSMLAGPACPGNSTMQSESIGVVGAGMAGLTMAWLLQYIGHNVTVLESSTRVGGRAHTHYGNGWYGDLGAMRFPPKDQQPLIHHLIDQFNCKLATFTNTNEGDSSYFYLNENYIPYKGYEGNNQTILKEIYELFGINTKGPNNKFPKDLSGNFLNPASGHVMNTSHYSQTEACLLEESVLVTQRRDLLRLNKPKELTNLWSVMQLDRAFLHSSFYQFNQEAPDKKQERASRAKAGAIVGSGFSEIINGTQMLPDAIFRNLTNRPLCILDPEKPCLRNVSFLFEKTVSHVDWVKGEKVSVGFQDSPESQQFDKVVLTTTSKAVSLMNFYPRLPYNQTFALDSFRYMNSVKIFLAFHTPFWAYQNKAPIIPFNSTGLNGGSGINDMPTRSSYYPSHSFHGNSILASYVWNEDADILTSMTEDELISRALADLTKIHGPVVLSTFKEGKAKKWLVDDNTGGAFPWAYPGDLQTMLPAMRQHHDGRLFFAGEYTSKMDHGWIQAAVESSCRVANDMFAK